MYGICSTCEKAFQDQDDFVTHSCVKESMASSNKERLERLVKSGGCSQEYYEKQMAKNL